jgi:hypothetical protein
MSDIEYEKRDIEAGAIVRLGIVLILVTALAAVASLGILHQLARREAKADPPPAPMAQHDRPLPAPFLQAQAPPTGDSGTAVQSPPQHLEEYKAREEKILGSYGWVDRNTETVRIPLAQAFDLVLARGVAAAPAPPAPASPPPPAEAKR